MAKINLEERVKMVKAMEFITSQINDESVYDRWLMNGVADGDIKYGDFSTDDLENDEATWYCEDDKTFAELMGTFLNLMTAAKKSGGLYCDRVVSS